MIKKKSGKMPIFNKIKTPLVVFLIISIFLLLSSIVFLRRLNLLKKHPSDEVLIERFNNNRGDFEELVKKAIDFAKKDYNQALEKGGGAIGIRVCSNPILDRYNVLSSEDIELFNELCKKLKIEGDIVPHLDPDYVEIYVSHRGLAISGSSKGYYYSEEEMEIGKVVDKKIDDNWYLFYWTYQ